MSSATARNSVIELIVRYVIAFVLYIFVLVFYVIALVLYISVLLFYVIALVLYVIALVFYVIALVLYVITHTCAFRHIVDRDTLVIHVTLYYHLT